MALSSLQSFALYLISLLPIHYLPQHCVHTLPEQDLHLNHKNIFSRNKIYAYIPDFTTPAATRLVQKGAARSFAHAHHWNTTRLSITPEILNQIRAQWLSRQYELDTNVMGGFVHSIFLRLGEMNAPTQTSHDPAVNLCFQNVSVDNQAAPQVIFLTIKQSKTDQLQSGNIVHLANNTVLCPVAALLAYLASRGDKPGPLFVFHDGKFQH